MYSIHFLDLVANCGGEIILEDLTTEVNISSPNYPNSYPENVDCVWIIKPHKYPDPQAYAGSFGTTLWQLHLEFNTPIDIEASESNCTYDYIEVG